MPDVVRRDAKRLSDVVRLKNGIKSRGFDTNQTNMDASDVIAPVGPPRTRSAMAAIHQQAMKGLRAPSTPLEVKLNDELSASAIKTKQAHDKLELRGAIVQQTKGSPAASWSWTVGRNTLDIATAEASYSSALGEHEQAQHEEYMLALKLQTRQRRPRASIAGFRCEEFDSHTIICDDNSLNDGEKYQQLLEAFHAGNARLDIPALTDEQSARALNSIFALANHEQDVRDHIHQLVTDMTVYKALIHVAIGGEEPRDLQFESLPPMASVDALEQIIRQRMPQAHRSPTPPEDRGPQPEPEPMAAERDLMATASPQGDLSRKFNDSLVLGGTPLGEIEHSERFELEIAAREARLQRAGALTNDPSQQERQMAAHIKQLEQQNELLRVSAAADQHLDPSQDAPRYEAPKSRRSQGPSGGSPTGSFLKNRPRVWHPQQDQRAADGNDLSRMKLHDTMSQQLRNSNKMHIPSAVLFQMQQPRGEDFGLGYELLKFVERSLKLWDGEDHLNTTLATHIKVFDEKGGMIENFYDNEGVLFYLSFKGLAKKKLDEFSAMLQTSTGYTVYNMPESAIQDVLDENGLTDAIQATNRAMMTFLLYKWFPVPEARTYALMLKKAAALHWRDSEGGKTESVHDFYTRLKDCEHQATTDKPGVTFLPPMQMRLLYIEGLPLELKQWVTAGVYDRHDSHRVLDFYDDLSLADEEQLFEQISRQYDELEARGMNFSRPSPHPDIPTEVFSHKKPIVKTETAASDAAGSNSDHGKCFNCGEHGHFARECPKPKSDASQQQKDKRGGQRRAGTGLSQADKDALKVQFQTIWDLAVGGQFCKQFLALTVSAQNIMMRWLQNTKNGGLGRGYSTVKEQVANYTGDDAVKLSLLFAACYRTGKITGTAEERRYMPTYVHKQSSALTKDEDGKDLIERAGNTDQITGLAWSQLSANLELFKDHYVKLNGKMVPQCYLCLQVDDHQACGCPHMAAVAKIKGESFPAVEMFSYPGDGQKPVRCIDGCAFSVRFTKKKTVSPPPQATNDQPETTRQQASVQAAAAIELVRSGKKLIVVYSNGVRLVCMVDSGAEISTMSAATAAKLATTGLTIEESPWELTCTLADGSTAKETINRCIAKVPLSYNNKSLCEAPALFMVSNLPGGVDVLLGRDILDSVLGADISKDRLKCFVEDSWKKQINIPYEIHADDRRLDPTMAPMQLSSNCDVEILSGADFDQLKGQLEEYHEAVTIDTMAQQAAQLLPKHRSAKHKEALKRTATTMPSDQLTAALLTPTPGVGGSTLPHEPRQLPAAKMEPQAGRLEDAKQNGGMVARFGSALLSVTVAMLAVGLFLSDLPMTAAADPYLQDAFANEATWTGHEDPEMAEDFIAPYLQHGSIGYQPLDEGMPADRWGEQNTDLITAANDALNVGSGEAMAQATGAKKRDSDATLQSDASNDPKYGPSARAEITNWRHITPKTLLGRLQDEGVDDGVTAAELRKFMDSLPLQPEGTAAAGSHKPPPEGDQRGYIPDKMVGGIDEQEQGWVAKCIADTTRWNYVLTPMEIFDPPEHHRRLELELLDNATIPRSDPRGTPVGFRELDKTFVKGLLEQHRICPSNSPVGSPMVFVPKAKKNETDPTRFRCCIDYRRINECLKPQSYRLPAMDSLWYSMDQAEFISSADAADGFWLAPVDKESRWLTAFNSVMGRFEWLCTPMGLQPASGHFQRFMEDALQRHGLLYTTEDGKRRNPDTGLLEGFVAVYMDDLIWWSDEREEHREQIERFLDAMNEEKLKMNPNKLNLFAHYTRYLGCIVGRRSLCMDPQKVEAVDNMATPTDASGVRQMVGMASFYRRWLPSFATMVSPLTDMLRMRDDPNGRIDPKTKKIRKVMIDFKEHWGDDQDKAVKDVKDMMTSFPVLRQFDPTKPCVLLTDGSLIGVGSVLCQEHDGKLCAVSYASHRLTEAEARYPVTEIEGLGILHAIRTNRHFLINNPFTIRVLTDHRPLQWSQTVSTRSGRLTRWLLELSDYNFKIEYIPGPKNDVADALSRLLKTQPSDATESIEFHDALRETWAADAAARQAKTETGEPQADSTEAVRQPLVTAMAAAQIKDELAATQFNADYRAAAEDLVSWGEEDADTLDCLPTLWQPFADPTGFESMASQMVKVKELELRDSADYSNCSDFKELHHRLTRDADFSRTKDAAGDNAAPGKTAAGDTTAPNKKAAGDTAAATRLRKDLQLQGKAIYTSDGLLAVPTNLRPALIEEMHATEMMGHRGLNGTMYQLRKRFYWPRMEKDVKQFIAACEKCQEAKSRTTKAWGGARANMPPAQPFTHYTIDFMFGFPADGGGVDRYDGLMVVVDQFSKRAIAIPVHEAAKAEVMAEAFYRKVVCNRGTPLLITSDRDSRFTGAFWQKLWALHHTSLRLTPAYSPWGDGQTERMNRLLEEILRTNVQADQANWLELCDGAVAAINASPSETTGQSPFEIETGLAMRMPIDSQSLPDQTYQNRGMGQLVREQMQYDEDSGELLDAAPYPGIYEYAAQEQHQFDHPERMRAIFQTAREAMITAKMRMNARLNSSVPEQRYLVGDVVKLKLGHYKMPEYTVGKASKLRQKYFGNFEVVAVHSLTAIELRLPEYMHIRVHPVIHPQYLKLSDRKPDGQFKTGVEKGSGLRELIEGATGDSGCFDTANGYGVDEIVAHRKVGAPPDEELEYLVRWENCSNLQVTWEPTSSLLYASKKLKQYHKKEREIRVAAEATNGLGDAPSLAFIETDLAALMLSDPARLGVKI